MATLSVRVTKQVRVLRDMLSAAIDRNLELKRQVDESQQRESELMIDDAAVSLVQAMRQTEAAMAEETGGTSCYVVSELQVSLKGFIGRRDEGLVLRIARSEQKILPEQLSTVTMTLARLPIAFPTSGADALRTSLERLQAGFGSWNRREGRGPAHTIVTLATDLLSKSDAWGDEPFVQTTASLAGALTQFAATLTRAVPAPQARAFHLAAKELSGVLKSCVKARSANSGDMARIAKALQGLSTHYASLTPKGRA